MNYILRLMLAMAYAYGTTTSYLPSDRAISLNGHGSYLQVRAPTNFDHFLSFFVYVKPRRTDAGLLLHVESDEKHFMHVELDDNAVVATANFGHSRLTLRSEVAIVADDWNFIEVWRSGRSLLLTVNDGRYLEAKDQHAFALQPKTKSIYIGGSRHDSIVAFDGCLDRLTINGVEYLQRTGVVLRRVNTQLCAANNACETHNCMNGGSCAVSRSIGTYCLCPYPYAGEFCHVTVPENISTISFDGDGFLKYTEPKIMQQITGEWLSVEMRFRIDENVPKEKKHIILAYAGEKDTHGDYFKLYVNEYGHATVDFQLGSGALPLTFKSTTVDDGQWHTVFVTRESRHVTLRVDFEKELSAVTPGDSRQLNVYSAFYAGGAPPDLLTHDPTRTTDGLRGCIGYLQIGTNRDLQTIKSTTLTVNAHQCLL